MSSRAGEGVSQCAGPPPQQNLSLGATDVRARHVGWGSVRADDEFFFFLRKTMSFEPRCAVKTRLDGVGVGPEVTRDHGSVGLGFFSCGPLLFSAEKGGRAGSSFRQRLAGEPVPTGRGRGTGRGPHVSEEDHVVEEPVRVRGRSGWIKRVSSDMCLIAQVLKSNRLLVCFIERSLSGRPIHTISPLIARAFRQ